MQVRAHHAGAAGRLARAAFPFSVTLLCCAVPAAFAAGLVHYLRPWRLAPAIWMLAAAGLLVAWLATRLRPRDRLALWGAALIVGVALAWYFHALRAPSTLQALDLTLPALQQVRQFDQAGDRSLALARLMEHFKQRPRKDLLTFPPLPHDDMLRISDAQLTRVFAFDGIPAVTLSDDLSWSENPLRLREWRFLLHEMAYVIALVDRYNDSGDLRYLSRADQLVFDWIGKNQHYLLRPPDLEYSWQDHDTARRARAWLHFWETWIRSPLATPEKADTLLSSLVYHGNKLADPVFYSPAHNHGIDQDIALIAIGAAFPEFAQSSRWSSLATSRLRQQIQDTIWPSGVHREHSPGYQVFVLGMLGQLSSLCERLQLTVCAELGLDQLLPKMVRFAADLIQPDGTLPTLGDTLPGEVMNSAHPVLAPHVQADPVLRYALTHGREGTRGQELVIHAAEGYAVFRHSPRPDDRFENDTYLLFTAAADPHLGHKHWDDLSFILSANGHQLLVDPGLLSYDSTDPGRRYVIGTSAHNTVLVDETSFAGKTTRIEHHAASDDHWVIRASHDNYPGVHHRRTLLFVKPDKLFVIDDLVARPAASEPALERRFDQLLHLAPDLEATAGSRPAEFIVRAAGKEVMRVEQLAPEGLELEVAKGQTAPMQGWVTAGLGKRVPAPVIRARAVGKQALFITRIALVEAGSEGDHQGDSAAPSVRWDEQRITLSWKEGTVAREAVLNRSGPPQSVVQASGVGIKR